MAQVKSLKEQILDRLNLKNVDLKENTKKRLSSNVKKASARVALGTAHGTVRKENVAPKIGDSLMYEGKKCTLRSLTESGMATVRFGNNRDLIVLANKLKSDKKLTEGILGMGSISPTYRGEPVTYGFVKLEGLDPEDIGLIFEDDESGEEDEQEEDTDNGGNVRHDGHTNKLEVDELPTPSDTISPAYSDEKPPKEISDPLSTHVGAQEEHLWDEPQWDGYDYPSDAPEIPTAEFNGSDMGNSRAPHFNDDEHQPGDGQEDRDDDDVTVSEDDEDGEDEERTDESSEVTDPARKKNSKDLTKMRKDLEFSESYFMREMDDLLGHGEDTEPSDDATITVTLPAMAAIMCTVANRVGGDHNMLRAIVEALAEVSKGKTIDIDDLDAVAAHVNGEELPEIENRDSGEPDHEGMDHGSDDNKSDDSESDEMECGDSEGSESDDQSWPGDGDSTKHGKTKLMGSVGESRITEGLDYYGGYDVLADTKMADEEIIRTIHRRAFPHGTRSSRRR